MRILLRLLRFKKLRNIASVVGSVILDRAIDALWGWQMGVEVAHWVIISAIIGFILWVFLHRDNETTARQLYVTLENIKRREYEVTTNMLPKIITENRALRDEVLSLPSLASQLGIVKFDNADAESLIIEQRAKLLLGNIQLEIVKENDNKLKNLNIRLRLLGSELLDATLEGLLNEYHRERRELGNITIAFKVERECFKIDSKLIKNYDATIHKKEDKLYQIESGIVERLSILTEGKVKIKVDERNRRFV